MTSELIERELFLPSVVPEDFQQVAEHWPFPLNSVAIDKMKVTGEELEEKRTRLEEAFWRNELGPIEY